MEMRRREGLGMRRGRRDGVRMGDRDRIIESKPSNRLNRTMVNNNVSHFDYS